MSSSSLFSGYLLPKTSPTPITFPSLTPSLPYKLTPSNPPMFLKTKPFASITPCLSTTKPLERNQEPKEQEQEEEEELEMIDLETRKLRECWREIQGSNHWQGLLDPMDPLLRSEIIRYGEFAQACYDAFDYDPYSKYCGTCRYHGSHFFEKLGMADSGYEISRYLYATSNINLPNFFRKSKANKVWSQHANWMGYVAVLKDEDEIARLGRRDIVISWRGTVTYLEWIEDLMDILKPAGFGSDRSIKTESGFLDLYTQKEHSCKYSSFSAREQILSEVKRLVDRYKDEELSITITGHSLGAALSLLTAYDIAEMKLNVRTNGSKIPITAFSFSGPRVGNLRFKERCEDLGVKVLRVINIHDKVPTVPGIITNEKFKFQRYLEETIPFPWSYAHVGTELALDHTRSPFLKKSFDAGHAHNLEALLHLVDGYHGKDSKFCLANKRDIALVNKCCDFLREEYGVPPSWRQDENKGMVRTVDGRWVVPERPRLDPHPPDTAHHLQQVLNLVNQSFSSSVLASTSTMG